ncbi:MAG: hypothetical protein SGJ13_18125 [Actinomycetota bacterium]|nr:hypothetical protein [Actinomycetota bacterium]
MHDSVRIPHRFHGPPDSGNGGFSAGLLASYVDGPAEVTLRRPPPLDRALTVEDRGDSVVLLDGQDLIAEAVPATVDLDVPAAVDLETATRAAAQCPTALHPEWHPFPSCFVCGPDRASGDGLRVFPGPVEGRDLFAAPVSFPADLVDGTVPRVLVWAALDCPSAYPMYTGDTRPASPYVLGRIAARVDREIPADAAVVATAWRLGVDGRKLFTASALFDGKGTQLAVARATWISL